MEHLNPNPYLQKLSLINQMKVNDKLGKNHKKLYKSYNCLINSQRKSKTYHFSNFPLRNH
jgi:hypothetical protein